MVTALAAFGLDVPGEPPPVLGQLARVRPAGVGRGHRGRLRGAVRGSGRRAALPGGAGSPPDDHHRARAATATRSSSTSTAPPGASGPLPCIYHIHGGGMVLIGAAGPLLRPLAQRAGRHRDGRGGRRVPQRGRHARPPPATPPACTTAPTACATCTSTGRSWGYPTSSHRASRAAATCACPLHPPGQAGGLART